MMMVVVMMATAASSSSASFLSHYNQLILFSAAVQGDFPWDEKDFRYMAVTIAGLSSALLYFYFRDGGREISWKDFVHRYLGRGIVRSIVGHYVQVVISRSFRLLVGQLDI